MGEIKPGDRVWIGPVKVWQREWIRCCFEGSKDCVGGPVMRWECHIPDEHHGIGIPVNGIDHDATIPDHPALPAVARWLAENPQAVADVTRMLVHLDAAGYFVSDWRGDAGDRASLHGLLAALEAGS